MFAGVTDINDPFYKHRVCGFPLIMYLLALLLNEAQAYLLRAVPFKSVGRGRNGS